MIGFQPCSTTSLSTSTSAPLKPPLTPPLTETAPKLKRAAEAINDAGTQKVLCGHCGRTADNGITCQGMCVADSDY